MRGQDISLKCECLLRRFGLTGISRGVLVAMAVLCAVLVAFALWRFWPAAGTDGDDFSVQTDAAEQQEEEGEDDDEATSSADDVCVDVEGAVANPGVYTLASGSRIADAVELAGGLTDDAARASVNLAELLVDGTQIYIPSTAESADGSAASSGSSGSTASGDDDGKININTASAEELQELSGIGEVLSEAIVAYREENGAFASIEDIQNVSGIGEARYESIKDAICV